LKRITAILVVLLIASAPSGVESQAKTAPRIGLLVYGNPPPAPSPEQNLLQGLREFGWIDGQNLTLVVRYADGRPERLADLARELVESRVDILCGVGTDVAKILSGATKTIPTVVSVSEDPVEVGLVASLNRPGGNITGVTFVSAELAPKRLEQLKEMLPHASRVTVLLNPTHVDLEYKELETAGRKLGIRLQAVEVRSPEELDPGLRAVAAGKPDALITVPSRLLNLNLKRIAAFALEQRLPSVSMWGSFTELGGLMTYGPDVPSMIKRSASHVDKILKGAKPADLPMERPTRFDFIVNLKTAKALGLTVPQSLRLRADRLIE
jgi:putative tryptophan/tyrosine transport system substrate-binding protein